MDAKKLLLEFIGRTCGSGNNVLHLASYMGQDKLVKHLIELGANVYKKNAKNYRPVDLVDDEATRAVFSSVNFGGCSSQSYNQVIKILNVQ
jgi:ankyrin repeat protein